jgi:hypothetical protein
MKKILSIVSICILFALFAFSEEGDHMVGGGFLKRIEYNKGIFEDNFNFDSKGDVEKQFYGDFNAPVEFFFDSYFEGFFGFRLVKDSLKDTNILEVKFISNYKETQKKIQEKYPWRSLSSSEMESLSKDSLEIIKKQNYEIWQKGEEAKLVLYNIESRSFPISNKFAELLYKKSVSLIYKFKAIGIPLGIEDGYSSTFRTVVDDEVWSLKIHLPQGKALKMSDLYRQIINDGRNNQLDETSYIRSLEN